MTIADLRHDDTGINSLGAAGYATCDALTLVEVEDVHRLFFAQTSQSEYDVKGR